MKLLICILVMGLMEYKTSASSVSDHLVFVHHGSERIPSHSPPERLSQPPTYEHQNSVSPPPPPPSYEETIQLPLDDFPVELHELWQNVRNGDQHAFQNLEDLKISTKLSIPGIAFDHRHLVDSIEFPFYYGQEISKKESFGVGSIVRFPTDVHRYEFQGKLVWKNKKIPTIIGETRVYQKFTDGWKVIYALKGIL